MRVGYVEILVWQGEKAKTFTFEGHDFKFKVSHVLGRMPEGNATISICNVSQETANELVTVCNIREALARRKTIKLYAGYRDPNNENYKGDLIATMDIINATITTPPPDMWLQITAVYASWLNDVKIAMDFMDVTEETYQKGEDVDVMSRSIWGSYNYGTKSSPIKYAGKLRITQIMYDISQKLNELQKRLLNRPPGLQFDCDYSALKVFDDGPNDTPGTARRLCFSCTLREIPTKLAEAFKVIVVWEERQDNRIYLTAYPDPKYTYAHKIRKEMYKRLATHDKVKFLDVDHGLIGIPKLKDSINLQCRCYLDSKIKPGDYVSVVSQLMPAIYEAGFPIKIKPPTYAKKQMIPERKAFQIMKITYTGHMRGNEWFCDIEARCPYWAASLIEDEPKPQVIALTDDIGGKLKREGWTFDPKTGVMEKNK